MKKALKIVGIVVVVLIVVVLLIPSSESKKTEEATAPVEETSEPTEKAEESVEVKEPEVKEEEVAKEPEVAENTSPSMDIIPNQTYCSDQGELVLYLNMNWDNEKYDDYGLDISGFGYENEKLNDSLTIEAHMLPDPETESCYNSEDGSMFMMITEDYISVVADSVEGSDASFSGDFYLVTDENSTGNNEEIMTTSEAVAFFRNGDNIGKEFKCVFKYMYRDTIGNDYDKYVMALNDYDQNVSMLAYADAEDFETNDLYFDGDHVIVSGIYLGPTKIAGASGIDISIEYMELQQ